MTEAKLQTTKNTEEWINDSIGQAKQSSNRTLEKYHFVATLCEQMLNINILSQLGIIVLDFDADAKSLAIKLGEYNRGIYQSNAAMSDETTAFFSRVQKTMREHNDTHLSGLHILLTLLKEEEFVELFNKYGVTEKGIISVLPSLEKERVGTSGNSVGKKSVNNTGSSTTSSRVSTTSNAADTVDSNVGKSVLDQFGKDLTKQASEKKLDPIIGRDAELRQIIQMLSRRNKNNPVVVGDPGVGKSALLEGLAQRIVDRDVPKNLLDKRVIELDMTSIIAGAKMRGEFEQRLKKVLEEVVESAGEIILFIDEIHTITENGAGDIMKPMLARGAIRLIGATTFDEYRENIEKDAALERRFQKIEVAEPSIKETVTILRGIVSRYEAHHEVEITDEALIAAANLSDRYVSDRSLPDKAIDLIDESAARLRMELDSSPNEIDIIQRQLDLLKLEEIALRKSGDDSRLEELMESKANTEEELRNLRSLWDSEQSFRSKMTSLKIEKDKAVKDEEESLNNNDYEEASRLRHEVIPDLIEQIDQLEKESAVVLASPLVPENVGSNEVAAIVESWTGIPVGKLLEGEAEKLVRMEEVINAEVVGQEDAVSAISDAVRRSRAGVNDPNRPTGSFMFLGPSGSGKTYLAKTLAKFLFDDVNAMVRVDMSEFGEKHSVSRLVGAPPGYAGYESGGQLTEAVRNKPYSVVLLDEVEKAHPEVFDILLQVFDDGRLTDGQGTTVDFRNTIIVLTSNLGAAALIDDSLTDEEKNESVMEAVRGSFRPEFINRLDEIVVFNALAKDELRLIVDLQVREFTGRLQSRNIDVKISDEAMGWLSDNGYDPAYGARPLRRLIQKQIGDQVAMMILEGKLHEGQTALVSLENEDSEDLTITTVKIDEEINEGENNE